MCAIRNQELSEGMTHTTRLPDWMLACWIKNPCMDLGESIEHLTLPREKVNFSWNIYAFTFFHQSWINSGNIVTILSTLLFVCLVLTFYLFVSHTYFGQVLGLLLGFLRKHTFHGYVLLLKSFEYAAWDSSEVL